MFQQVCRGRREALPHLDSTNERERKNMGQ